MLAAHRAAELDHQVGDLAGDRPERLHALPGLDVDHRADVQAADVGMSVARGRDPVACDDLRGIGRKTRAAERDRRPCPRRRRSAWRRRPCPSAARTRPCGPSRSRPCRRRPDGCGRPARPAAPRTVGPGLRRARPARRANRRRTGRPGRPRAVPRRSSDAGQTAGSAPPGRGSSGRASRRRPVRSRRSRPDDRGPRGSWRTTGRPAPARPGAGPPSARRPATTASVPSEPTINRARLNCQGSSCQPTGRTGRPGTNSSRL